MSDVRQPLPAVEKIDLKEEIKEVTAPSEGSQLGWQQDDSPWEKQSLARIEKGVEEMTHTVKELATLGEGYLKKFEKWLDKDQDYKLKEKGDKKEVEDKDDKQEGPLAVEEELDDESKSERETEEKEGEEQMKEEITRSFPENIIPKVRECTAEDFTTYFSDEHGRHVMEVLLRGKDTKTVSYAKPNASKSSQQPLRGAEGSRRIDRIRINSKIVLTKLAELSPGSSKLDTAPRKFFRPFEYFIHSQDKMKLELAKMEKEVDRKQGATESSASGRRTPDPDANVSTTKELDAKKEDNFGKSEIEKKENEIEQVRCYVNFIEERILASYKRFRTLGPDQPKTVSTHDLCYLFKAGDFVYVPDLKASSLKGVLIESTPSRYNTDQRIWRVLKPLTRTNCECSECVSSRKHSTLICYYIDYDGKAYRAIEKRVEFPTLLRDEDEVSVTELPVYPIQYVNGWEDILKESKTFGKTFSDHLNPQKRYSFYNGWTLTRTPLGDQIEVTGDDGKKISTPEHIESTVLIDFLEAFNLNPNWKPTPEIERTSTHEIKYNHSNQMPILQYSDSTRSTLAAKWKDWAVVDEDVGILQMNDLLAKDQFLSTALPKDDDLALLPRRVFAYAIWDRKFVVVDVRSLQRTEQYDGQKDSFDLLKIPNNHKGLIESLIKGHFDRKQDEDANSFEISGQDLIRGKGKGIIILLHGVPGVGKTATAEAVAERFQRPLFPITCGDLGSTAKDVEKSLNGIFRLAHLWNCVLLLDEAEIFITQRDRQDLNRNALVSVFLRMLEYYNGVLFLTTNRPGALDEAVKSRVHLSLQYNSLNRVQTMEIFQLNIDRLKKIEEQRAQARKQHVKLRIDTESVLGFAEKHYDRLQKNPKIGRWNGRQIRNAFLIAASLAHFEGDKKREKEHDFPKLLSATHFQTVEETTDQYDKYRLALYQQDDDSRAREFEDRLDDGDANTQRMAADHRTSVHTGTGQRGGQYYERGAYQNGPSQYLGPGLAQDWQPPARSEAPKPHPSQYSNGRGFDSQRSYEQREQYPWSPPADPMDSDHQGGYPNRDI
ncbi:hypothetical protein GJ744_006882 [Endocarpon pusillum]|uniref:AAA+ ATPase domain-containing protein n=1 Tax=Endocarpon pusillum TaxID=364733 RepID=A0A8H7A6Q0_9EURO|nr:hypothetical protein GJ744_006882 [Endocarpon pusillum]